MGGFTNTLGLYFEIGADPSKGQKAVEDFASSVEKNLGMARGSFGLITSDIESKFGMAQGSIARTGVAAQAAAKDLAYLAAGAGAIGLALFAAAEKAAHFAEEIGHVSEKSGATVEQVSTLKFAADRVGVSFEAVGRGLGFLAKNLGSLGGEEGGKAAKALADLGIKGMDAAGHIKPVSELLPLVTERLGAMGNGALKTNISVALFGRGGRELIPVMNEMRRGFQAVEDQARSMGLVIGEDDVRAARVFLLEQRTLTAHLEAFALTIGREVMPHVTQLFIKLEQYPLLLKQIALDAQAVGLKFAAVFTGGASLALLAITNRQIAENTKKMDEAITGALVKLDAEARAALAAGINVDKHADSTKKGKKSVDELTESLRGMLRATQEEIGVLQSVWKERREIINQWDHEVQAADKALAATLREAQGQKVAAQAKAEAERIYSELVPKLAEERDLKLKQLDNELTKKLTENREKLAAEMAKWAASERASMDLMMVKVKNLGTTWQETLSKQTGISVVHLKILQQIGQQKQALEELREKFRLTYVVGLTTDLRLSAIELIQWSDKLQISVSNSVVALQALKDVGGSALRQFGQGMAQNVAQAVVYGRSVGEAMRLALKATLASIAAEAGVQAIYATALGFLRLAQHQYHAAAQAFVAAGIFATIGGVAAAVGAAVPGARESSGGAGVIGVVPGQQAAQTPPTLSPGAAGAKAREEKSASGGASGPAPIIIQIQGDYLATPQSADHLIAILNQAVERRDVRLISTRALKR